MDVLVESKVPRELVQAASLQTSKVSLPVSFGSGSLKVAVNVGVCVPTIALSAGETSVGVEGARFVVLFVIEPLPREPEAAGLPVGVARSRILVPPGCV
jgi:hypothetical protein